MKMAALSFWGILLILIGLSLVVKTIFNLDFSIFRIVIAFVFIYIGIKLFVGKQFNFFSEERTQIVFGEQTITNIKDNDEFNILFSGAKFQLQNIQLPQGKTAHIKINTIFGGSEIKLPSNLPIKIKSHTVFGGTQMPNGNTSAFGEIKYVNDSCRNADPVLTIETNTVFGGVEIKSIEPDSVALH